MKVGKKTLKMILESSETMNQDYDELLTMNETLVKIIKNMKKKSLRQAKKIRKHVLNLIKYRDVMELIERKLRELYTDHCKLWTPVNIPQYVHDIHTLVCNHLQHEEPLT